MRKILLYILAFLILASCSTSNQVVSNKLFQKRKYQKGWHVNSSKSYKKEKEENQIAVYSESNIEKDNTVVKKEITRFTPLSSEAKVANLELDDVEISETKKRSEVIIEESFSDELSSPVFPKSENIDPTKEKEKKAKQTIDRKDPVNRFFLGLLALGIIMYLQLSPLAILIGVGKVNSLQTNLIIWLLGIMFLAIGGLMALYISYSVLLPTAIAFLIAGGVCVVIAHIHAIAVIFRGY